MRKCMYKGITTSLLLSFAASCAFAQTANPSVEFHGYIQNRLYTNPNSKAQFAVYRMSLQATAQLANNKKGYVELYYQPWVSNNISGTPNIVTDPGKNVSGDQSRIYLESAYMDMPFLNGSLRMGKGRQLNFGMLPTYANRKTSDYNILAETFTQDRIQGFQYAHKNGTIDFGATLYADNRIEDRSTGQTPGVFGNRTVKHFAERDDNANLSGEMAFAARFGVSTPCFKIHASGAVGGLCIDDATRIANAYSTTTTDKKHNKYGLDAMYNKGNFVASGEYYVGNFSFLKIDGYSALLGYEPKDSRRFYARYSALNNNQAPNANQQTWNIQQLMLGVVQPLTKGNWIEVNYEKNTETGGSVKNDVLMTEFFTSF